MELFGPCRSSVATTLQLSRDILTENVFNVSSSGLMRREKRFLLVGSCWACIMI